ncbi:MAG: hypothetical protein KDA65_10005 [Planctomycetaceae bacterium]|nr:hypothetical protein [Planctomycetaceae bacterium]
MPHLPRSKTTRLILIGLLSVLIILVTLYWIGARNDYRREEFARTTTIEQNPWGIKKGMTFPEIEEKMPAGSFHSFFTLDKRAYENYQFEIDGADYEVSYYSDYDPKPEFEADETLKRNSCTAKIMVVTAFDEPPPYWLEWLGSLFRSNVTVP